MAEVRIVFAKNRMTRLDFSGQVEWTEHVVHIGEYECPWCNEHVEFRTQYFEKHETQVYSNLKSPWLERFNDARPIKTGKWESFLDFYCPGCGAPVRIIYEAGGEYSMGSHPWRLTKIVEAAEWSKK
jgi:predicted RNA-binding Zn-ribbon protein involved in translation (DUF1610 family)